MNVHSRAVTVPASRALLICRVREEGWKVATAAEALGISRRSAQKWLKRFRLQGEAGLRDRSSRPHRIRRRIDEALGERIVLWRRQRRLTALALAVRSGVSRSTIGRLLRAEKLSKARQLEDRKPIRRYEHESPGDLLHLDVKKLGRFRGGPGHRIHGDRRRCTRGIGWEYLHVCIDDHSRLAYVELLADELRETTAAFLQRALRWYEARGIHPKRILTDNGGGYRSKLVRHVCDRELLKHVFTRPYHPQTNGKAERFIRTALTEWAYGRSYRSSAERRRFLPFWLHFYNHHRPHSALTGLPPAARVNNLVSLYS